MRKLARRSYSISSSILDDDGQLLGPDKDVPPEFYIVLVESDWQGTPAVLTPRLFLKEEGDRVFMGRKAAGRYRLDKFDDPTADIVLLSTGTCRPDAAFDVTSLVVAYEVHPLGYGTVPREIVLAAQQGPGFTSENVASTSYGGENRPSVHCAIGRLWIDWIDATNEMAWTRQLAPGQWTPVDAETFDTTEERDYHVRGAIRMIALE